MPSFIVPNSVIDPDGKETKFPQYPEGEHKFFYEASRGLRFEPEAVRNCIRAGKIECEIVSLSDSLTIASVQDEIRRQVGVKYAADDE